MITYVALAIILGAVWLLFNIIWAGIAMGDPFTDGGSWARGTFVTLAICAVGFGILVGGNELLQLILQQLMGVGSI